MIEEKLVIYHGKCSDGFTAAWAASRAMPEAMFYPANHGEPPPDVADKEVYILDFSYKRATFLELKTKAKSITLLDHHRTAAQELYGLDGCIIDMRKSGARLAWEYFAVRKPNTMYKIPWLVLYAEDRDLWRWSLPHSREVNAALNSYRMDFAVWDSLDKFYTMEDFRSSSNEFVLEGSAIRRFEERQLENIVSHAREIVLDNHQVLAANTSVNFSEVAGRLACNRLFGIAWYKREDGKYVYSLRSEKNGIDVSEIAARHGGGGHMHSAGFEDHELILKEVPLGA